MEVQQIRLLSMPRLGQQSWLAGARLYLVVNWPARGLPYFCW